MNKLIVMALSLTLVGCANKEMGDLQAYIQKVKSRPPAPLEPIPQIKQAETFLYIAAGRRNPFEPEEEGEGFAPGAAGVTGLSPDLNRRKEELEHFSLDALNMVGTLEQNSNFWGLVQTTDGTIHRVKPGEHLGRNYGLILGISEDRIDLRELVRDGGGGYIERQAALVISELSE